MAVPTVIDNKSVRSNFTGYISQSRRPVLATQTLFDVVNYPLLLKGLDGCAVIPSCYILPGLNRNRESRVAIDRPPAQPT
jgi:hypothetical protein